MREGQPDQSEADGHDLGRGAARAQVVEPGREQEQKQHEEHLGWASDRRTQHRRVQHGQRGRRGRDDKADAAVAKGGKRQEAKQREMNMKEAKKPAMKMKEQRRER